LNHWSIRHRIAERHAQLDQRRTRIRQCEEELFGRCEVRIARGDEGNEPLLPFLPQLCESVFDTSQASRPQRFAHGIYVLVSTSGKIHYDDLIAFHVASDLYRVCNSVRRLERGNDAFQLREELKRFQRFAI